MWSWLRPFTSRGGWISLKESVARAGSLEALLSRLKGDGRALIPARAAAFYAEESGRPYTRPDNAIPPWWWDQLVDADDYAINRARFEIDGPGIVVATGIELERAVTEVLFPVKSKAMKLVRESLTRSGGRPTEHRWSEVKAYVDGYVAGRGPLPRNDKGEPIIARAVELMTEWFEKNDPPSPKSPDIYKWLRNNPQTWWD